MRRLVSVVLGLGFLASAGFALSGLSLFQPKRAPTALRPSSWTGTMTYLGTAYRFELAITEVDDDGDFRGTISWPDFLARSGVHGVADGAHLVFTDADRDEKDVVLDGVEMRGTDKNGRATFVARRADVDAGPPALPPLKAAWARRAAVCDGLTRSGWAPDRAAACWRALAKASQDLAACKRVPYQEEACAKEVAGEAGDLAGCQGDVPCLLEASLHGAGEAACERLGTPRELARCLAGVRRSAAPCEGLDQHAATSCLDHLARVTLDADACEALATPDAGDFGRSSRDRCFLAVGGALRDLNVCERLPEDPRVSTLGALARKECQAASLGTPTPSLCERLGSSGERSACLLRYVGETDVGEAACGAVSDAAMKEACVLAARLPPAPAPLPPQPR